MYTNAGESTFPVSTVPAFLTKLWTLVEDPTTDELICWDASGQSFHVLDQARFAKEILPLYFKHNNIASFIRQLNMYGFRKVVSSEAVNVKIERDDMEFAHKFFLKGQERLLEFIKRKVPNSKVGGVSGSADDSVVRDDARVVLSEMTEVKSRQDHMTVKLENLKLENEVLWREVASLRQMHMKQQHVVSKLIHFLVSVVGNQKHQLNSGLKRKAPLMLGAATNGSPPVKLARDRPAEKLYQVQSAGLTSGNSVAPSADSVANDDAPDLFSSEDIQQRLISSPDTAIGSIQADPTITNAVITDAMEPLAIWDPSYPPSLELTDVQGNSKAAIIAVPLDDILPSANTGATTSLGNTVVTTTATATTSNPLLSTTALALTDSRTEFDRNDLASHLDMTHSQISGLRELISGSPQINIDPNVMLELFGYLDANVLSMPMDEFHDEEQKATDNSENNTPKFEPRASAVGNELIQYMPADDFSSLYDINDLITSYDPSVLDNTLELATPGDEEILDPFSLSSSMLPTQKGRQTKMEDVD